jgi:hypothetical protein
MSLDEHYERCLVHLHTLFTFDSWLVPGINQPSPGTHRGLDLVPLFHVDTISSTALQLSKRSRCITLVGTSSGPVTIVTPQ